jgi:hypothetical protein
MNAWSNDIWWMNDELHILILNDILMTDILMYALLNDQKISEWVKWVFNEWSNFEDCMINEYWMKYDKVINLWIYVWSAIV